MTIEIKRIVPSVKILDTSDPIRHLEYVGKICTDAKPSKTKEGAAKFLRKLIDMEHYSVFEHYWYLYTYSGFIRTESELHQVYIDIPYLITPFNWAIPLKINKNSIDWVIMENYRHDAEIEPILSITNKKIPQEKINNKWIQWASIEVECSLACRSQWMRHRLFSYMERSLRMCKPYGYIMPELDYLKTQYINVLENPISVSENNTTTNELVKYSTYSHEEYFEKQYLKSIKLYENLLRTGYKKEDARAVLPLCTATKFICTGPIAYWNHFFSQRAIATKYNRPQGEINKLAHNAMILLQEKYGDDIVKPERLKF